jgi:hypothetical protein
LYKPTTLSAKNIFQKNISKYQGLHLEIILRKRVFLFYLFYF